MRNEGKIVVINGWMTTILPSLCDIVQSNYAIACGAKRRKTTLLRGVNVDGVCETGELVLFLQE